MDTEQIKTWIRLQEKDKDSLRVICRTFKLPEIGNKEELINIIIAGTIHGNPNIDKPQAIPLRTRDNNSQLIREAANCLLHWRKLIFKAHNNIKEFSLLNNKGEQYSLKMRYLQCTPSVAEDIIRRKWYLPYHTQKNLIESIVKRPNDYTYHIIQKPSKSKSSWIMLHVERQKQ